MYNSNFFECAVVYGRRRIGKTTLIQEFIKDKKAIYFLSLETSERVNLENFSRGILDSDATFANFSSAFDSVADLAADERIVLVI